MRKVVWISAVLVGLLLIYFGGPADYAQKCLHYRSLDKARLIAGAEAYRRTRTKDQGQYVCLYVVKCDANVASLERVDDIRNLDIERLKKTIWNRRFDTTYCPGRTTNIGLHLIPEAGHSAEIEATAQARWSFFNDRFIPQRSRFQSGYFTDKSWQPCTPEASLQQQLATHGSHL